MALFNSLWQQLNDWYKGDDRHLNISSVDSEHWPFLINNFRRLKTPFLQHPQLIIYPNMELAEAAYPMLKKTSNAFFFPSMEISPYSGTFPPESVLGRQFATLAHLSRTKSPCTIVTTVEATLLKIPPQSFFLNNYFILQVGDRCDPLQLSRRLVEMGYTHASTVEEPGSICHKGEIFDVYPSADVPVRIHYFDDTVEEIFPLDLKTNRTIRDAKLSSITLDVARGIFSSGEYPYMLRKNLPKTPSGHYNKHTRRQHIFEQCKEGKLFEEYPILTPLFFSQTSTLLDYVSNLGTPVVTLAEANKCEDTRLELLEELRCDFEHVSQDSESDILIPKPELLFREQMDLDPDTKYLHLNKVDVSVPLSEQGHRQVEVPLEPAKVFLNTKVNPSFSKADFLKGVILFLVDNFSNRGNVVFSSNNDRATEEFKYLIDLFDENKRLAGRVQYDSYPLKSGFFYETENTLVLTDADLFSRKKTVAATAKTPVIDLFAEQLSTLKEGDYVIHTEHGLGQYLGLQSINTDSSTSDDYMVILYQDGDKVYVPMYKLNLVQKYAGENARINLNSLRSNKFGKAKSAARKSAKKLAFDLLKLQAKRASSTSFEFSPPDHYFREFELAFPFKETKDQLSAINAVIEDMQKNKPMDRLVCGDVGFGKTEVAMRAAFKAVEDKKQVAVLVPTTILSLQHHNSFTKRFENFPVSIEVLSRFKSPKESKLIKEKLKNGDIDIIIGTHKLLSSDVTFFDLGLVVVDEEQRFGVAHKEKLKLLKESVDFLTLTATPIPRTLQLVFLSLRDMSLIQTAPPKRQSIKSYVIREDDKVVSEAILKELQRGGQVFMVHNRVRTIESYREKTQQLVPKAKILVAHGQLSEQELEKRIKAFYAGEYNILISTTIIENGIDIPNVNTIIIDRAHTYGLAQLHQLRGRIGRSDRKAYAYMVVPKDRKLSSDAQKRLHDLRTYADIGKGFNLACCDLENRGAGDILSAEQSGHLEKIGLELYMGLLKDAIAELKGELIPLGSDIEITTPFTAKIPDNYIKDGPERIKFYKKLSSARDLETLESISQDLENIYGTYPQEVENLLTILECRTLMQNLGIRAITLSGRDINLKFDEVFISSNNALRDRMTDFCLAKPNEYKLYPDFRITHGLSIKADLSTLLKFCQGFAEKMAVP